MGRRPMTAKSHRRAIRRRAPPGPRPVSAAGLPAPAGERLEVRRLVGVEGPGAMPAPVGRLPDPEREALSVVAPGANGRLIAGRRSPRGRTTAPLSKNGSVVRHSPSAPSGASVRRSTKHHAQSWPSSRVCMIGWPEAWKCFVACRFGLESQQFVAPQVRHWRRWTHVAPIATHASQTSAARSGHRRSGRDGDRWLHGATVQGFVVRASRGRRSDLDSLDGTWPAARLER